MNWKSITITIGIGSPEKRIVRPPSRALIWALLAMFCASCGSKNEDRNTESAGAPVRIVSPMISTMVEYLQLTATTVFLQKEIVRAPFQGYVLKTLKNVGEKVRSGDIVFLLQTKESHAVDNAGEADLASNGVGVAVRAKSSGVLTQLDHQAGDYVSDGDQIALIVNPRSLVVLLNVPYQKSAEIRIGSGCSLVLPGGKTLAGRISRSIPSVDASSQTQTYVIDCDRFANLPENLNLIAKIPVRTVGRATVLPKSCVLANETLDKFWIMKIIDDRTAAKLEVVKGIENDSLVQILAPHLSEEDTIVAEGGYGLPDTATVSIER